MNNHELIVSGNHLELTESLKTFTAEKTEKLFRHEGRIIRIRVELSYDQTKHHEKLFTARGIIEINGPDLVASHTGSEMHAAIDQMVQKLDRMLRNRARHIREKRNHPHPIDLPAELPKVSG